MENSDVNKVVMPTSCRPAAKSHRGPSGAPGRRHPRAAQPCGGTVHRHERRPRRHAQPHRTRAHAQRRHGSSGLGLRLGAAGSQQTLAHGRRPSPRAELLFEMFHLYRKNQSGRLREGQNERWDRSVLDEERSKGEIHVLQNIATAS